MPGTLNTAANQGVQSYSSVTGQTPHIIFCVGQSLVRVMAFRSWASAEGLPFKSLHGSYEGKEEESFIVSEPDFVKHDVARWVQDEESILVLGAADSHSRRPATLRYIKPPHPDIDLGLFKSVPRKVALKQSGWTYDPSTGEYYTTMPRGTTVKGMMY